MSKKSSKPPPKHPQLPTYSELAELVAELSEIYIDNLDGVTPHVACFTYGPVMPAHWQRAIDAREALIANQAVPRQNRHGHKS